MGNWRLVPEITYSIVAWLKAPGPLVYPCRALSLHYGYHVPQTDIARSRKFAPDAHQTHTKLSYLPIPIFKDSCAL